MSTSTNTAADISDARLLRYLHNVIEGDAIAHRNTFERKTVQGIEVACITVTMPGATYPEAKAFVVVEDLVSADLGYRGYPSAEYAKAGEGHAVNL